MFESLLKPLKPLSSIPFRIEREGWENLPKDEPVILISNHVSLADAAILHSQLPDQFAFALDQTLVKEYISIPKTREIVTYDPLNPASLRHVLDVIETGKSVVMFPEGRITTTGTLMRIQSGVGYIAMKTGVKLIPVALHGLEPSKSSCLSKYYRTGRTISVRICIGTPFSLEELEGVSTAIQKRHAADQIYKHLSRHLFETKQKKQVNLYHELIAAANLYGMNQIICEDPGKGKLSYRKFLTGVYVLSEKLRTHLAGKKRVGVLLPTSVGHAVLLFSLFRLGITPAILNFSAGSQTNLDACETAEIDTVITAQEFVDKGGFHDLVDAISQQANILYTEKITSGIRKTDLVRGVLQSFRLPLSDAENNEVILFTSGSENKPKGVVLTHDNLYANILQATTVLDVTPQDRILNALPMFHSFGLTVGTLLPILRGIPVFLYPSPKDYKTIPQIAYMQNTTILFGTSTFFAGYASQAHETSFYRLRYAIAGAEKLREEVRKEMRRVAPHALLLEGYGVTEASPVVAVNTLLYRREGTVGKVLPGIDYRIEPVEGLEQGGKLLIKGPNLMKGYLIHEKGFIPAEEWYDTGDVVEIDEDGFVKITSRLKRFAKVGGEMVPLNFAEEVASLALGDPHIAIISVRDERRGEKLVLYTTNPQHEARLQDIKDYVKRNQLQDFLIPKEIRTIPEIPQLGSGKTDYVSLQKISRENG